MDVLQNQENEIILLLWFCIIISISNTRNHISFFVFIYFSFDSEIFLYAYFPYVNYFIVHFLNVKEVLILYPYFEFPPFKFASDENIGQIIIWKLQKS